ncbi:MAG: hypothetical protein ACOX2Q_01615 [Dehalobacterium sp.]|jgi:hypothetical protein
MKTIKGILSINSLMIFVSVLCIVLLSFFLLNGPGLKWEEGGEWQVKVYQKANHMMTDDPPWIKINELNMKLTRPESIQLSTQHQPLWCLEVKDLEGNELLPGVSQLLIYYSDELKVVQGYGLNKDNKKVIGIDEFFSLSLYGAEFFSPQRKRYQNLFLLLNEQVKIELSEVKGIHIWYDKAHPWWVTYESNEPPLKAQLQI